MVLDAWCSAFILMVVSCTAGGEYQRASRVVLATGHSSRGLFEELLAAGVTLTAKHFAMGFRIEHPQVRAQSALTGYDLPATDDFSGLECQAGCASRGN